VLDSRIDVAIEYMKVGALCLTGVQKEEELASQYLELVDPSC